MRYKWFSLHAAVSIEGSNRAGLRQLFHYGARSSVNLSLLSYVEPYDPDRSELELRLKRKWNDGSESLIPKNAFDFLISSKATPDGRFPTSKTCHSMVV